ncbi:MAG: ABC transporter ATP-binding protein [Tenuifilum sp.]|uniref:ABC transporter ATP-binding protein n=1 Tax=Tenuifilum sp. TaxID=2760880 RepID=UPI0030AD25AB
MLKISDLTVSFSGNPVVSGINFSLMPGEILGFVGESGSGKSVTSLALMGLLPPNAKVEGGSALFSTENGQVDLLKVDSKTHRQIRGQGIAMIFQEPQTSLNPSMICGKQISEAVELHTNLRGAKAKERCLQLLAEMQLTDPAKVYSSYPHQLSGGQKQRVMIAMALAGNPRILIADEPTTALDVTVQKSILQLLKDIRQRHQIGIIFITHDLSVVAEVADRIMVMQQGQIVEQGTVTEIFNNPTHPYTRRLIEFRKRINQPINATAGVTNEPEPIFRVNSINVEYGSNSWFKRGFKAISNVSFTLFKGETLGLVGESGSGKSTLGRTLLKLIETQSGTIEYNGKPLSSLKGSNLLNFRREVQLIFQDPYSSLNPRLTIGQALMEPFIYHGLGGKREARKAVEELLQMVSLPADSINRYPHEFSGGQRQRIVIARALVLKPKILVCDEILSALDVSTQAQMLDLLQELKKGMGLTYLFISHDLSVVRSICSRVIVLNRGSIEEQGPAEEIFSRPQSVYTQLLIDAIPGKSL